MTPQSSFAVVAAIEAGRGGELRALLASMNHRPGVVDPANGLVSYFVAFDANIARQFEYVQDAWIMGGRVGGLADKRDFLVGSREPVPGRPAVGAFSLPQAAGLRRRISGLPQFVTVRGRPYFFLPGLRALRYLTGFGP